MSPATSSRGSNLSAESSFGRLIVPTVRFPTLKLHGCPGPVAVCRSRCLGAVLQLLLNPFVNVSDADALVLADANRWQLTAVDQLVHRRPRAIDRFGNLARLVQKLVGH